MSDRKVKVFISYDSAEPDFANKICKALSQALCPPPDGSVTDGWLILQYREPPAETLRGCVKEIFFERSAVVQRKPLPILWVDDSVWSGVETIKNLVPTAAGDEELHDLLVHDWADVASSFPEPYASPHLAWGLNDLFDGDRQTCELAIDVAHRMASSTSCDATRSVLGLLGDLKPRFRKYLPTIEARKCAPGNVLRTTTLLREAEAACRLVRRSSDSTLLEVFEQLAHRELAHLRGQMARENPLAHFVALASLKFVIVDFCAATRRRPSEDRRQFVERLVGWVYDPAQPETSAFVATELLTPLWETLFHEMARCAAARLTDERVIVRRSIIAGAVKHYERATRRRAATRPDPFDITAERVVYRALPRDPWSGFGQAAAETATRDATLIPYLHWANVQLQQHRAKEE